MGTGGSSWPAGVWTTAAPLQVGESRWDISSSLVGEYKREHKLLQMRNRCFSLAGQVFPLFLPGCLSGPGLLTLSELTNEKHPVLPAGGLQGMVQLLAFHPQHPVITTTYVLAMAP